MEILMSFITPYSAGCISVALSALTDDMFKLLLMFHVAFDTSADKNDSMRDCKCL